MEWIIIRRAGSVYDLCQHISTMPNGEYAVRASNLNYHDASFLMSRLNR